MNKYIVCIFCLVATSVHGQENDSKPIATLKQYQNDSGLEKKTDTVAPNDAAAMVATKQAVIIDVREESELNQQKIPGAIHIPLSQLKDRLAQLEQYRETPIITQCQRGGRSQQALTALKSAGFSKVYNLEGGIVAWGKAGLKTD